ncbi:hypothetical protein K466DRAFT_7597 [Polyporus arcularius HHB13444]|uniref:Uncharacterized protein n=1 Tax=Polyporus arcularius HHB13444 TaxID=1314778 RepID=A0A5C3P1S2_9APHY|nr:hypothetical protein K466DRAFT_7597 [Polyporus arcularius HHB13444]
MQSENTRASFPVSRQMQIPICGADTPDTSALPRQLSNLPGIEIVRLRVRVMRLPDWNAHTRQHCSRLLVSVFASDPVRARTLCRLPVAGRAAAFPIGPLPGDNRRRQSNRDKHTYVHHRRPFEPPQPAAATSSCPFIRGNPPCACRSPPSGNQPSSQPRWSRPSSMHSLPSAPCSGQRCYATSAHYGCTVRSAPSPDARLIAPHPQNINDPCRSAHTRLSERGNTNAVLFQDGRLVDRSRSSPRGDAVSASATPMDQTPRHAARSARATRQLFCDAARDAGCAARRTPPSSDGDLFVGRLACEGRSGPAPRAGTRPVHTRCNLRSVPPLASSCVRPFRAWISGSASERATRAVGQRRSRQTPGDPGDVRGPLAADDLSSAIPIAQHSLRLPADAH